MPRYKITIEYDGSGLVGWQKQENGYSVQQALEAAIIKFSGEVVETTASGRTDAGVHALGQVVHFDLAKDWDEFRLREAINFYIREDKKLPVLQQISVISAAKTSENFNARFDAKRRYYIYRIVNRRSHLTLDQARAWCVHEELNAEKMHEAAQIFVGQHDFSSFRASECQAKSPVKTLESFSVERRDELIEIKVAARSFLHHQVRNMAGSLRLVGNGKWEIADLLKALEAKNRKAAGETAPAHALYLVKVDY